MARRIWSFVVGGLFLAAMIALGIAYPDLLIPALVVGVLGFCFLSCLILYNNVVMDVVGSVMSWGFIRMPTLIFELDLDGIIWFLTVKLLFWLLGIVLAILLAILAIAIGSVVALFVYPFALYKNIKHPEDIEI